MKYMLLIAGADEGWDHLDEAGQRALYARIETWWDERKAAGELLEGAQLQPSTTATTTCALPVVTFQAVSMAISAFAVPPVCPVLRRLYCSRNRGSLGVTLACSR